MGEREPVERESGDALDSVQGCMDIYGRSRSTSTQGTSGEAVPQTETSTSVSTQPDRPLTEAEKQKAALERLRGKRTNLSPPRPSHFREKSSRSRSAERKREARR